MEKYEPQEIERGWQKIWEEKGLHKTPNRSKKPKYYCLVMFPYSSGDLHIGHWYNFAPADVFARYKRMKGYNVLHPVGFDSFGLPAEGAAIKRGIHPRDWTEKNVSAMTKQLKTIGATYDWDRVLYTHRPDYYHWTQWMFLLMFKRNLAYKKEALANWCPKCKSILANEQAEGGRCWRCGVAVEQREIEQWFFKITKYADKLLEDLEKLDWPEKTKKMQRNWIGKSVGVEEYWPVEGMNLKLPTFTTWPHTSWGATFVVIAPEHPVIHDLVKGTRYAKGAREFCEQIIREKSQDPLSIEKEKRGFFTGRYAINHLTGERMKIFIANFAVMEYGTGIIKGVPAHDRRDFEFAKKYRLEIRPVIKSGGETAELYVGEGVMINAGPFTGIDTKKAREAIADHIIEQGNGKRAVNYHLRDWLVSRQRYWGAPIPIVYCSRCGIVPVPEKDLPILLPKIENYLPVEGESPLARAGEWVRTRCPQCHGPARRETDTMDTFVCSSWYFLRYADPANDKEFASKKALRTWLPVDMYIGGAEHTVLHLLYSRFFVKVLRDAGYLHFGEPFASLRHQGIILGEDGHRMSKSRGNVINPDNLVRAYGADTVRLYLCFLGPYAQGSPWNPRGIEGTHRFLRKVWQLATRKHRTPLRARLRGGTETPKDLKAKLHRLIKKVGEDIEVVKFNTAVAAMMEFLNEVQARMSADSKVDERGLSRGDWSVFLRLLAPFAPHIAEELWQRLNRQSHDRTGEQFNSIHIEPWPKFDPKLIAEEEVTITIQVNGKLRARLVIPAEVANFSSHSKKEGAKRKALSLPKIKKYTRGGIKKTIFVPGKLINFVT